MYHSAHIQSVASQHLICGKGQALHAARIVICTMLPLVTCTYLIFEVQLGNRQLTYLTEFLIGFLTLYVLSHILKLWLVRPLH